VKDENLPKQVNSSLYAYVGIPIGAGKAKEENQKKGLIKNPFN
jgi:hypothetical protein